jgi:hypothetical protein
VGSAVSESIAGYIIISVVCCAVLTSIGWVIIIYQTRKRHSLTPTPTTCPEFGLSADEQEPIQNQATHLTFIPKAASQLYLDNNSEHSSDKDSGTGDCSKRSSDNLILPVELRYPLIDNTLSG